MEGVAAHARAEGDRIVPLCGYARAWLRGHRTHRDPARVRPRPGRGSAAAGGAVPGSPGARSSVAPRAAAGAGRPRGHARRAGRRGGSRRSPSACGPPSGSSPPRARRPASRSR
ncbi:MAG: hypothetical protein PGN33_11280 [Methylobacterium radiotolerans]